MNERILELAVKSGLAEDMGRGYKFPDNYLDFAELIVAECIKEIGYKSVELLDIDFYPHYQERLKKHFGVEA